MTSMRQSACSSSRSLSSSYSLIHATCLWKPQAYHAYGCHVMSCHVMSCLRLSASCLQLRTVTGVASLPSTLAYTCPTIAGMAEHIQPLLSAHGSSAEGVQAVNSCHTNATAPVLLPRQPEPAVWLPKKSSIHLAVILPQLACLLLLALLRVASFAAPTALLVTVATYIDLWPTIALISPVIIGCKWAIALLAVVLRWILVSWHQHGRQLAAPVVKV